MTRTYLWISISLTLVIGLVLIAATCGQESTSTRPDASGEARDAGPTGPSPADGALAGEPDAGPSETADAEPSETADAGPSETADAAPVSDAAPAPATPDAAPTKAPNKGDGGAATSKQPGKQPGKQPEPGPDAAAAAPDAGPALTKGDAGPSGDLSPEARKLTALVQKAYSNAKGFEADFQQTYRNRLLGRQQKSKGHVWLRPPSRMRWEYTEPNNNVIIADGRTLFVYEPEENQVIQMPVSDSELPAVMAFLTGGRDLALDYHVHLLEPNVVKTLAARGQAGLDLHPRRPSSVVARVVLVFDRETGRMQKTVLVEPEGNTNTFLWSNVRTDVQIPNSRFTFTPPPGVRVIKRGQGDNGR